MGVGFSPTRGNGLLDAVLRSTSSGYSSGKLASVVFMGGPGARAAGSDSLLSNITTTSYPVTFSAPSDGVMVATPGTRPNAVSTSTVSWIEIATSGSVSFANMDVGLVGSGAECILATLASTSGQPCPTITNLRIKIPKSVGTVFYNAAFRNAVCEIIRGGADGAISAAEYGKFLYGETANSCVISLYGGTAPADADQPASGSLLGSYTVPNLTSAVGVASGLASALSSAIAVPISGTGTITHFRVTKTHAVYGTMVMQGTAGTSGTDAIVASVNAVGSGTIDLTALTVALVS